MRLLKTEQITFKLNPDQKKELDELCNALDCDRSRMVRNLVVDGVKSYQILFAKVDDVPVIQEITPIQ